MTTKLDRARRQLESARNDAFRGMGPNGSQQALDAANDKAVEALAVIVASKMGAKGGSSTSPAKRAASAENGKKGGRPSSMPKTVCWDDSKKVWYPEHEFFDGVCARCGAEEQDS